MTTFKYDQRSPRVDVTYRWVTFEQQKNIYARDNVEVTFFLEFSCMSSATLLKTRVCRKTGFVFAATNAS